MVAPRMRSQEVCWNSNGGTQTQIQFQNQDPSRSPLARQGSMYNLTLDEVQNQLGALGKPLNIMNLDELLKNVFTVETNNQVTGVAGYVVAAQGQGPAPPASGLSLNQNPGLMLPMDLSKKTVDEVWQDIQDVQKRNNLDQKATLGEMTLEDFLVKAGVVAESSGGKKAAGSVTDSVVLSQQAQWMSYRIPSVHSQAQQQQNVIPAFMPSHPVQQPITLGGNHVMDAVYPETMSSSPPMGTLSDTQTLGRKRIAPDDIAEKSVERRQKRMIKNRESAARSRARKQAYTHELESKVSLLEQENDRLKRLKELEKVLSCLPPLEPRYQLRRTSSAPL